MDKIILLVLSLVTLIFSSCFKKKDGFEGKEINIRVEAAVKGMDPIYANDRYSGTETARVYEGLYEYHYLKRPYELVPNVAESMPEISADGLTYKIKIRKGVLFHDDPAFPNGVGREVTAEDFVYSFKRLSDPKLLGLGFWVFDNKIAGLNEWRDRYSKLDTVDYSEEIEGVKALDKYTLQIKLNRVYPQFLYALAMPFTYVVAKEVVEKYSKDFLNHPIGTGPFMIKDGIYKQSKKIVYLKNPKYRKKLYPCEASEKYKKMGFLKDCGKQLPLVDRLTIHIIEEEQPRWLNFLKGKIDFNFIPKDSFASAVPMGGKELGPDLIEKGIILNLEPQLDITYNAFNMELDLFKNNKKLRQAMFSAYNINESNRLFYNSVGIPAQSLVPPGIKGYVPAYQNPNRGTGREEDIKRAKLLLKEAGYPDGKGLPTITLDTTSTSVNRQIAEYFKTQMAQIGINIKVIQNPWPRLQEKIVNRQVMMHSIAWSADYPDAENFLMLLYSKNKSPGPNGAGYTNPKYDELFEKAAKMQDSPERTKRYEELNQFLGDELPWLYGVHRQDYTVLHSWLKNLMVTDFEWGRATYLNIDLEQKKKMLEKL